ncbi:MAG: 50S ribosomal protein L10 [Candidatus Nanohaloarchaea archaeon]
MVQPEPKQMTREMKEAKVEEFVEKIERYPVIGILDMHNLPSKQLQQIKKDMKEFADIKMSRKTLMDIAIDKADKEDIEKLNENEAEQPAFIFSERDPFQLYSLIQNNKTSAAAQGGEEAPNDIEIPDGDTGIGPGPMLGKLQGAGLDVQVDDGSIHVQEPGVLVEKGETITGDDAEILSQVGIEPLEIGLDLDIAYSEGEIFTAEQLDIDVDEYRDRVENAAGLAFNLAVNAGVVNERTAPSIIGEAAQKARNVSISEGIPTEETIKDILATASSNAEGVDSQVDLDSVEVDEAETEEPEEDGNQEETEEEGDEEAGEDDEDQDPEEEEE